jgi:hypothetical protein
MIAPRFFIIIARGPGGMSLNPSDIQEHACTAVEGTVWEETRRWQEFFRTGSATFAVSEAVAKAIQAQGMRGVTPCPLINLLISAKRLQTDKPPSYYWLHIRRGIELDPSRLYRPGEAPPAGRTIPAHRCIPLLATWNRSDLFIPQPAPTPWIFCTRRFLKLAHEQKWKGLRFIPMDVPDPRTEEFGIDYLKRQWPPQWYPDGVEGDPSNLEETDEP